MSMPMAHLIKTWPAKFKVSDKLVGKRIVTEVRRPEPAAVLTFKAGDVIELTQAEYNRLFHGETGPAILPPDLLTLVTGKADEDAAKKALAAEKAKADEDAAKKAAPADTAGDANKVPADTKKDAK